MCCTQLEMVGWAITLYLHDVHSLTLYIGGFRSGLLPGSGLLIFKYTSEVYLMHSWCGLNRDVDGTTLYEGISCDYIRM